MEALLCRYHHLQTTITAQACKHQFSGGDRPFRKKKCSWLKTPFYKENLAQVNTHCCPDAVLEMLLLGSHTHYIYEVLNKYSQRNFFARELSSYFSGLHEQARTTPTKTHPLLISLPPTE
jgi:hypothetical protein